MVCDNKIIRKANLDEIEKIYNDLILENFPKNEIKPLKNIINMFKDGCYFVLVCVIDDCLAGAALVASYKEGESYLLDYLVVDSKYRNMQIGSTLLNSVVEEYTLGKLLLIETETIRSAKNDAQIKQRNKRNSFYSRSNCKMSDIITNIFGAEYNIWYVNLTNQDLLDELQKLYHYMVPDSMYEKNVIIPL